MPTQSKLWDRDYRAPRRPLPEGSWDCHFHVFGSTDEYPLREGRGYTPVPMKLEAYVAEIRAQHAALGIEHGLLAHPGDAYGTRNVSSARALQMLGPGYRASALIDMAFKADDIRGLSAVGLNSRRRNLMAGQNIGLDGIRKLRPAIDAAGWHVEVMCQSSQVHLIEKDLRELGLTVVIEHCGFASPTLGLNDPGLIAMRRLLASGSVYVKLSGQFRRSVEGAPFEDMDQFTAAFLDDNPDFLIWGSDWPFISFLGHIPNLADLLDQVHDVAGASNFRKLMVDNPLRLHRH
jgi:predicted TIM-barrel fold metal-dependent hydrolase